MNNDQDTFQLDELIIVKREGEYFDQVATIKGADDPNGILILLQDGSLDYFDSSEIVKQALIL